MSNIDIAKKLNISEDWLIITAKKLGLPKKGSGWKYQPEILNLDIKTKEFSYFLGWMASDGNISKTLYNVRLSITDKEIIDKFIQIFPSAKFYSSNYNNKKPMFTLNVCSKLLALKLGELGIVPNKTKILNISSHLFTSHFVRGFIEGDGYIRKSNRYEAGFVSASKEFTLQMIEYLKINNIKCSMTSEKNYFRVYICGKDNLQILYDFIYKDCDQWYLKRKKQILDLLFSNE